MGLERLPLWDNASPELRAAISASVQTHQGQVAALESRVADLEARLGLDSTNSHKPPSTDFIGAKRKPPAPPTGKKRGGQPGRRKARRDLVPPDKVRETIIRKPTNCRRCGRGLSGDDPAPLVHQVAESPRAEPAVDEYRLHSLARPVPAAARRPAGPCPRGSPAAVSGRTCMPS